MPDELLMSTKKFFKHGQVGNWLGQANSVTCLPKGQAGIQVFVEPCLCPLSSTQRNSLVVTDNEILLISMAVLDLNFLTY